MHTVAVDWRGPYNIEFLTVVSDKLSWDKLLERAEEITGTAFMQDGYGAIKIDMGDYWGHYQNDFENTNWEQQAKKEFIESLAYLKVTK